METVDLFKDYYSDGDVRAVTNASLQRGKFVVEDWGPDSPGFEGTVIRRYGLYSKLCGPRYEVRAVGDKGTVVSKVDNPWKLGLLFSVPIGLLMQLRGNNRNVFSSFYRLPR